MTALEVVVHQVGGIAAFAILIILLVSIWRGTRQQMGRSSGLDARWLHSPVFYAAATVIFVALSFAGWRRLPLFLPVEARLALLVAGSLLFFPGLGLMLWARLTLGKMYYVSSGFGAQLFVGHKLVTNGPFALMRHPMYVGLIAAGIGSLFIYLTWTGFFFAVFAPFVLMRARGEEKVLAEEFGEEWKQYCRKVPVLWPKLSKRK